MPGLNAKWKASLFVVSDTGQSALERKPIIRGCPNQLAKRRPGGDQGRAPKRRATSRETASGATGEAYYLTILRFALRPLGVAGGRPGPGCKGLPGGALDGAGLGDPIILGRLVNAASEGASAGAPSSSSSALGAANIIPCPFSRAKMAVTASMGTETSREAPLKRAENWIRSLLMVRLRVAAWLTLRTISPFLTNSCGTLVFSSTLTLTYGVCPQSEHHS